MLKLFYSKENIEAGCDEAGRGCIAGPVFAAAVILPSNFKSIELNDSKQVNETLRMKLRTQIENQALAFHVAMIDNREIDKINILKSSFKAMHLAIDELSIKPTLLLIDGNRFTTYPACKHVCIVKGDAQYASIAAASILAKTYRDEYMMLLHRQFPYYNWNKNKGYPTKEHRNAVKEFGLSKYHRTSFACLPKQLCMPYGV